MINDADGRYLASIADDCHRILGPGVDLEDLAWAEDTDGVRLTLRYRLDGREGESVAVGETVVAAHAALRERLVIDRIRLGFMVIVDADGVAPVTSTMT